MELQVTLINVHDAILRQLVSLPHRVVKERLDAHQDLLEDDVAARSSLTKLLVILLHMVKLLQQNTG